MKKLLQVFSSMKKYKIFEGNSLELFKNIESESIDSIEAIIGMDLYPGLSELIENRY